MVPWDSGGAGQDLLHGTLTVARSSRWNGGCDRVQMQQGQPRVFRPEQWDMAHTPSLAQLIPAGRPVVKYNGPSASHGEPPGCHSAGLLLKVMPPRWRRAGFDEENKISDPMEVTIVPGLSRSERRRRERRTIRYARA